MGSKAGAADVETKQTISGAGVFVICMLLGIIFDQLAIGICFGLIFGGGIARALARRD